MPDFVLCPKCILLCDFQTNTYVFIIHIEFYSLDYKNNFLLFYNVKYDWEENTYVLYTRILTFV